MFPRISLPSSRIVRRLSKLTGVRVPPLNFITLHYAYFISVCLVSSLIFWGSSTPSRSISYTDSLFFTVSAMTLAGLNTVNLSTLNTFQQFMLFVLIILGSAILVSSVVVHVRRKAFEAKFEKIVLEERRRKRARSLSATGRRLSFSRPLSRSGTTARGVETNNEIPQAGSLNFHGISFSRSRSRVGTDLSETNADSSGALPLSQLRKTVSNANSQLSERAHNPPVGTPPHKDENGHIVFSDNTKLGRTEAPPVTQLASSPVQSFNRIPDSANLEGTARPTTADEIEGFGSRAKGKLFDSFSIGRNSTFHDLTDAQREELGGVEYRAISFLAILVPIYFVLFQLLGCLGIGAYMARNKASVTRTNGINPWWAGAFFAVSAFNNSGMSLLDANMMPFQASIYMLFTMSLLILAGNTCYPVFLRLIIYAMRRMLPNDVFYRDWQKTLQFLLDHPRRCYTNLFPSRHTWWLVLSVVVLNGVDWVAFEVLNIGNPAVEQIPTHARILDGLFQAFAVRSGGFYIIGISSLRIGLQVLYVVMMYISVYPVVITMRNSNIYEERSLGIYADEPTADQEGGHSFLAGLRKPLPASSPSSRGYFMQQQLRAQIAHDTWWIVLAIIFITIIETGQFERDPKTYSAFNIMFEIVSAYGCVGISTGLPDQLYSFSGGWHKLSKLILCAVMLRGRHRGLPVAIDRAVLLPGEHLAAAEEEDARIRMERTFSRGRAEVV